MMIVYCEPGQHVARYALIISQHILFGDFCTTRA